MNTKRYRITFLSILMLALGLFLGQTIAQVYAAQQAAVAAAPATTAFTYQGRLDVSGAPANGKYDFSFSLYDAATAGTSVATPILKTIVVTDGLFTTSLDFGNSVWNGDARFLDISVKETSVRTYTPLTPRQEIGAAPHANFAPGGSQQENLITVAKSGGDYETVQDALASITDATADNPYLIHIGPGVYSTTTTIDIKPYVSVQGSGQGVTIIRGFGGTSIYSGTIRVANFSPTNITHLTIESDGTGQPHATAFIADTTYGTDILLSHVSANATNATSTNVAIYNRSSAPILENIQAHTSSSATNWTIFNTGADPSLTNVTSSATNGAQNVAIYNSGSTPDMRQITASATDGVANTGILSNGAVVATLDEASILVYGGSNSNTALYYAGSFSAPKLSDVYARAAGTNSAALVNVSGETTVRNSILDGGTYTVDNRGGSTIVHGSEMNGTSTGIVICHDSIDEQGLALDTSCNALPVWEAVSWDNIANIPTDLADGETDWSELNSIPSDLSDGQISWSELTGLPVDLGDGQISWSELNNIPSDLLDGDDTGLDPANIVWVAKSGGDFTDLAAALASITDASATNPYLIRIGPGVYNNTSAITLKDYVDIEGSGQNVTILKGDGGSNCTDDATITVGYVRTEIRHLTVESDGTGQQISCAINGESAHFLSLLHVSVIATGGNNNDGLRLISSRPRLTHVTIEVSGGISSIGIYNNNGRGNFNHVSVSVTDTDIAHGIWNTSGGNRQFNHVHIEVTAMQSAVGLTLGTNSHADIAHLYISVDEDFNVFAEPDMKGIVLGDADFTINDVEIEGFGLAQQTHVGIEATDATVEMTNIKMSGTFDDGLLIDGDADIFADNIHIDIYSQYATSNQAIEVRDGNATVQDSTLLAAYPVWVGVYGSANVANSMLDGTQYASGTLNCFGNYTGAYAAASCP